AVADDGHHRAGRAGRFVADEPRVAMPRLDGLIERDELGVPGKLGLAARAAPLALPGERGVEPRPVDPDAVFGRELDREVDREAERVVQTKREITRNLRDADREIL